MADVWIKADLDGQCVGRPVAAPGGSASARWYRLRLERAVLRNVTRVPGPPPTPAQGPPPFQQDALGSATVVSVVPAEPEQHLRLADLTVTPFDLQQGPEDHGRTTGRLRGTLYARVTDDKAEAAPPPTPDTPPEPDATDGRVDRWGCLWVLLALLVMAWLWWRCGPFTCALWCVAVGASAWAHRRAQKARPPLTAGRALGHGLLGVLLTVAALGIALDLLDPVAMATCGPGDGLRILWVGLALVAASVLAVSWPLQGMWVIWTVTMLLWCGRSGTDCAGQWGAGVASGLQGAAPDLGALQGMLEGLGLGGAGGGGAAEGEGAGTGMEAGGGGGGGMGDGEPDGTADRMSVEEALQQPERFFGKGEQRVVLSGDLLFQFDEDTLRPAAEPKLRQVARLLRMDPQRRVVLEGHADTIGGNDYNLKLSKRRAEAVRAWLVQQGHINPAQVSTEGYGSARPLVPRSRAPNAQQPNRRVEIRVLAEGQPAPATAPPSAAPAPSTEKPTAPRSTGPRGPGAPR